MMRVLVRLVADAVVIGTVLFASARTFVWERAWMLVAVLLVVRIIGGVLVYRANPELARERAKPPLHDDQPWSDKILLLAVLTTGFVGLPMIAALDVFYWRVLPRPAAIISGFGLLLFALGWTIKALALRTNAFATTVVRVQHERQHAVVDTGVYRIVRHPFYAGTPLVFVGLGLWLESYAAALLAVVPIALVVIRLQVEERFLRRELPGYADYAARVRYRLLPGIW
jgi:protein-S-isoprenylcysteine O-methyltransferase Ste14